MVHGDVKQVTESLLGELQKADGNHKNKAL